MKTFRTVGSGSSQTIEPIENNKIPVYETKTAAETDLANLSVGQIIATKDEGNELPNPVDVVQDGNMHAVTSNAVALAISNHIKSVVVSASTDSGGNAYLGYDFTHMIPIAFVPISYGADLVCWQFGIYGNSIYIVCNRKNSTIKGTLYYLEH